MEGAGFLKPGASSPPPLQFRRLVSGRGLSHVRYLVRVPRGWLTESEAA